jgi:hypothetical protein
MGKSEKRYVVKYTQTDQTLADNSKQGLICAKKLERNSTIKIKE